MAPFAIYDGGNEAVSFTMSDDCERVHQYAIFRAIKDSKTVYVKDITCQDAKRLQESGVQELVFDAVV